MYSNKSLRTTDDVVTNKFKSTDVVVDDEQDNSMTTLDLVKCAGIAVVMGIAMLLALGFSGIV